MKRIIFHTLYILCIIIFPHKGFTQEPVFSQSNIKNQILNPALAGFLDYPLVSLLYRTQNQTIPQAYKTISLTGSVRLNQYNTGLGINIINDNQGDNVFVNQQIKINYSYLVKIQKKANITLGAGIGYNQFRINKNNLIFSNMINQQTGQIQPNQENLENIKQNNIFFSTGILIFTQKFFSGISINRLKNININGKSVFLPPEISIQAGIKISTNKVDVNKQFFISPGVIFVQQKTAHELNFGTNFGYNNITAGLWLRSAYTVANNLNNIVFISGFKFKKFEITYSYDTGITPKVIQKNSAHEIGIIWFPTGKEKINGKNTITCPAF